MRNKKTWLAMIVAAAIFTTMTAFAGGKKYNAVCNTTHSLNGSWWGPDRTERKDAEDDAAAHKKKWTNHSPEIFERSE